MWVTKLLISPVKIRIFCQRTTKFSQKLAFLPGLWLIWCPVGGLVGGCCARAVSRKTPIYFIILSVYDTNSALGEHDVKGDKSCDL